MTGDKSLWERTADLRERVRDRVRDRRPVGKAFRDELYAERRSVRERVKDSIDDPRSSVPLEDAFDRLRALHKKRQEP